MSWLARLDIDAQYVRNAGIRDTYSWHKKLWEGCFPNDQEAKRDFLTRIDQFERTFRVWVLAKRKPVSPAWCPPGCFVVKEIAPSFFAHRYYVFDLRANPVKAVVQRNDNGDTLRKQNGKRKSGKRVPLVKQDELRNWLIRKGEIRCLDKETGLKVPGGFRIVEEKPLEISPAVDHYFRKREHEAYHGGVQFRGTLEVTDQAKFIDTYHYGVGSAKAFGFGLFLLAPSKL